MKNKGDIYGGNIIGNIGIGGCFGSTPIMGEIPIGAFSGEIPITNLKL